MEKCRICNEAISDGKATVVLRTKGSDGVNRASSQRGSDLVVNPGETLHVECRRNYCKADNIARDLARQQQAPKPRCELRSELHFNFQEHCLFCGQSAKTGRKQRELGVFPVRTEDFQKSILQVCHSRNDEWSATVLGRIASVNDLHAADAVYHQQCSSNFRTGKNIPTKHTLDTSSTGDKSKRLKLGRPEIDERTSAFLEVAQFLEENDEEQTTIHDLVLKMSEFLQNTEHEPYSAKYMKTKIKEHFGERVIMTVLSTKECVVTLRDTASSILYVFHKQQKAENIEDDKLNIIEAAAKLIASDVKSMETAKDFYPDTGDIADSASYIPNSLQLLLRTMFAGKKVGVKLASIGQAIMQAIRPRAIIAPLQLGLGIQMHHHFASRFLVDTLHAHGFSSSYAEVMKYERSAAVVQGTEIPGYSEEHHIEYIADNVDHNVATIDGTGTFHGMGIIAAVTPETKTSKAVPKVHVTAKEIAAIGRINIQYFKIPPALEPIIYNPLVRTTEEDPTSELDILWKTSLLLHSPRPSWSGMMQFLHRGQHPGKASVTFLPMIDLDPSHASCIYSTMKFVSTQAQLYDVTPVLTFDQPLYWKALTIMRSLPNDSDLKRIVLRLGGFHMQMSFLGSIGHLMAGSGLQELLEVVYAGNTVPHMMTGKAVSRAVRGHMLVDAALNTILVADAYNVPVPTKDTVHEPQVATADTETDNVEPQDIHSDTVTTDITTASELYARAMSSSLSVEEVCSAKVLQRIQTELDNKKEMMTMPTAKLWLQYLNMVDILRKFIKAERTGNWRLHLQCVHDMLPYLAASGHRLYTKSAYVYLQMMTELPNTHPDVYNKFQEGYHVVRRSDRYWAGLSTDLIIEQVLMRSIKTHGGLTRGKGMTETQRLLWVLSMPACANINDAMQKFSGVSYETSDQHKDISKVRQARDVKDTLDLISYLKERDPFKENTSLHNIANGMAAQDGVNVDQTKEIGDKILVSMAGKSVEEFTFRKADEAMTLASRSTVKVRGESVVVDPQLVFQRLVIVGERCEDLSTLFKFELCSHPPALFDSSSLPLQANKAVLADVLWKSIDEEQREPSGDQVQYVLDGGALLHRIPWPRGSTYDSVCQIYVRYVTQKYGAAVIVFDGYKDEPTTKDATQQRRTGTCSSLTVNFAGDMIIKSKKEDFLNNKTNKQRFIHFLSDKLERAGCSTEHAKHDADVRIVQTALASARTRDTVLIGDDTDLLVLLLYHADMTANELFLVSESKQATKSRRVWCIKQSKELLGPQICDNLLFVHAILGCDTTSRLFGLGKGLAVKKVKTDSLFREQSEMFHKSEQTPEDITAAGEKALVSLYGGTKEEGLDSLRYKRFCDKISKSTSSVEPQTLPPTSAAARFHSLRVYYQVMEWKGTCVNMKPQDWGWHIVERRCMPIQTDQPAAPPEILDVICCSCKKNCKTRRCTCQKYGLHCTAVCRECRGTSCSNSQVPDLSDDVDDDA